MAKNKIIFEHEIDDVGRALYRFTGSQRQPTINEIIEFLENKSPQEIEDCFMVLAIKCKDLGDSYQGFGEPEETKTVEFWGYDGGVGSGNCPICGHERDLSGDRCPVCLKPWNV